MKCAMFSAIMLVAFACVLPASAETFVLNDGKEIEGTTLRTNGRKVTLKTKSGVSTYDVLEFDQKTRDKHFEDLETVVVQAAKVQSGPETKSVRTPMNLAESKPKAVGALVIAGAVICVISSLWFIIAGFAESVGWGIALILFNGIAGLAFLILHWDRAKSPVLTYLLGIGLMITAALLGK